jgi:hypothetical protein
MYKITRERPEMSLYPLLRGLLLAVLLCEESMAFPVALDGKWCCLCEFVIVCSVESLEQRFTNLAVPVCALQSS